MSKNFKNIDPLSACRDAWEDTFSVHFFDRMDESLALERVEKKLNLALGNDLHKADINNQSIQKSYANWEIESPSIDWFKIDESLSLFDVKQELNESLQEESELNKLGLNSSYNAWNPELKSHNWESINESLSQESVWKRLESSLDQSRNSNDTKWWIRIAASMLFFFCAFILQDGQHKQFELALSTSKNLNFQKNSALNKREIYTELQPNSKRGSLKTYYKTKNVSKNNSNSTWSIRLSRQTAGIDSKNDSQKISNEEKNIFAENSSNKEANDWIVDHSLRKKSPNFARSNEGILVNAIPDLNQNDPDNIPVKKQRSPFMSLSAGTLIASMDEVKKQRLKTYLPGIGYHVGINAIQQLSSSIRLSQNIGLSRYKQTTGLYDNAVHVTGSQDLNFLQGGVNIGYTWSNLKNHIYTGVNANKLLSGIETRNETVSNVFSNNKSSVGMVLGYERFWNLDKNLKLVSGISYYYVPKTINEGNGFKHIHGLKLSVGIAL